MNLQFFANAGADDTGGDPEDNSTKDSKEESKNPEFTLPKTAEELQKLLQSEADKRVTQAIKTAQEKWQKEYETNLRQNAKKLNDLQSYQLKRRRKSFSRSSRRK